LNVGSGGGAAAAPAAGGAAAGGAAAEAEKEEEKVEGTSIHNSQFVISGIEHALTLMIEKEESDDDMGFGLFD
jgi:large subunit ribosomal protein LP1